MIEPRDKPKDQPVQEWRAFSAVQGGSRDPFGFLLLAYAAMGISVLIVLLLLFLRRILPERR